ncbi:hypothetical protein [Clostridium thailandense]|uniref:hypothetical protein n=1 Tax=Clostridium thailandense TaxID=2794346 RepID=UPI001FE8FF2B|nr:hypothetical protein [Clostridium thailandense]
MNDDRCELIQNLDKLHTIELGVGRIKKINWNPHERLRKIIWRYNKKYTVKGKKNCENKRN